MTTSAPNVRSRQAPAPTGEGSPKRRRGRPPGAQSRVAAERLGHHHFSFLRAALQLPTLRQAWLRYLAFEGGPDDERHFAARLKQLQAAVRLAAYKRGLDALAEKALAPTAVRTQAAAAVPVSAAVAAPNLDDWVQQRCELWGVERDFQSEAEWLADYQAEFAGELVDEFAHGPVDRTGRSTAPSKRPALAHLEEAGPADEGEQDLRERLDALNTLALELARAPALDDPLTVWLSPQMAAHLIGARVRSKPNPVRTVGELIDFINLYRLRWHRHVPRLGATRGERLLAWLQPVACALGRPLKEASLQPHAPLALHLARTLQTVDMSGAQRFGLVPLDRLAVPPQLEGRRGPFRPEGPNVLGAQTDLEAIFAWLERHQHSRCTHLNYSRIVERFYLWCVLIKRKPMSALVESDFQDYRQFLANPPADWIQHGAALRASEHWRPFKGPVSPNSMKLNFSVISAMLSALVTAGYLTANAVGSLLPAMRLPATRMNIDRSFDEVQWKWIMRCWMEQYVRVGPPAGSHAAAPLCLSEGVQDQSFLRAALLRRLRLVLELGATTGLRLSELVSTRRAALQPELVDGRQVWILKVLGKGNREREILVPDDVVDLLAQHHRDLAQAEQHFGDHAAAPDRAGSSRESVSGSPVLIGALRPAPAQWTLDAQGLPQLQASGRIDRCRTLSPNAASQSLKRFLKHCASRARELDAPLDADRLAQASTHWLRHFFANTAAEDGVNPAALMSAMGHKSLQTTSVYLRTDRRQLVKEMAKVRRRS